MAIKWKNNREDKLKENDNSNGENLNMEKKLQEEKKPKLWLGVLLVFMAVITVAIVSYKASPVIQNIRKTAEEQWAKQQEIKQTETLQMNSLTDMEKMSLICNMYYLDYKLAYMYQGISAEEYLLRNNKTYIKATEEEKKAYGKQAVDYMEVLYSVYCMDYSVGEAGTHTYMEDAKDKSCVGATELVNVLEGKDLKELYDTYQSFLVLSFDENGELSISTHGLEEGNFSGYVNNIKLQAVVDYFLSQDMPIYHLDSTTIKQNDEEIYEEEYEEEVEDQQYQEVYEEEYRMEDDMSEDTVAYKEEYDMEDEVPEDTEAYEEEYDVEDEMSEDTVVEATENSVTVSTIAGAEEETKELPQIKIDFPKMKNKNIVIGFRAEDASSHYNRTDDAYEMTYLLVFIMGVILLVVAIVLQNIKTLGLKELQIFKVPTEILFVMGAVFLVVVLDGELPYVLVMELKEGIHYWMKQFYQTDLENLLAGGIWVAFYSAIYFFIANSIPYILHPIKNVFENSVILRIILWLFKKCKKFFIYLTTLDVEKGIKNNVLKIVALNFVLLTIYCCLWFFGIIGVVIYSICIYIFMVKKGTELKRQYDAVLSMTRDMAEGNLNVTPEEDLGVFEPVKQELMKVRQGFSNAVEEEVRSRNMKTELITNVSHDLKTPLTAIITYVNLLKEEGISEETRKEYVETLDKKSQRLKVLIEDLFEVSKATSNNITLHYADMDIVNLIKQVRLENEEQIANSELMFRWELPEEKCILRLDPQKTYRIIENLIVNALKYSMAGSRVYVQLENTQNEVVFTIKNISATELNLEPEKLTERFVRGDVSRNTEGSGLGLAIVQSFTEVQGGNFDIEIDGDLFKAIVKFTK